MILHIDIDCFFAAAHRVGNTSLENIPIAVGGRSNLSIFDREKQTRTLSKIDGAFTSSILSSNDNKSFEEYFVDKDKKVRGIITTSSYEARAYGVKTAMSVAEALRYCPHLTVIPPNYPLYHELSHKLKLLLEKQIPTVEQFSIDEYWGDVTGWIKDSDIKQFALTLQKQIKEELGLPVSIGVAKTKWIAKLATDEAKPNGVIVIEPDSVESYIQNKPIEAFCGIGKKYEERLKARGIKKLGDVKEKKALFETWGKNGVQLYDRILGIDNEELSEYKESQKSIGLGRTFDPEPSRDEIKRRIAILCRHLAFLAYKGGHSPMTYGLKIRYRYGEKSKDFVNTNRIFSETILKHYLLELFTKIDIHRSWEIIQLNVTLSNFAENKPITTDLFSFEDDTKQSKLTNSLQKLRDKFGIDIIKSGGEM